MRRDLAAVLWFARVQYRAAGVATRAGVRDDWAEESTTTMQQQQATYAGQCGPKASEPNRPRTMRPSAISERITVSHGTSCCHCGAWRGELGAERIVDCMGYARGEMCSACYLCHLRMVLAGLWRVLRDDGVCFMNLGDSYSGSNASQGGDGTTTGLMRDGRSDRRGARRIFLAIRRCSIRARP